MEIAGPAGSSHPPEKKRRISTKALALLLAFALLSFACFISSFINTQVHRLLGWTKPLLNQSTPIDVLDRREIHELVKTRGVALFDGMNYLRVTELLGKPDSVWDKSKGPFETTERIDPDITVLKGPFIAVYGIGRNEYIFYFDGGPSVPPSYIFVEGGF